MKARLQDYVVTSPNCISLINYAPCITSAKEFVATRKGRRPTVVKVEIKSSSK